MEAMQKINEILVHNSILIFCSCFVKESALIRHGFSVMLV